MTLTASERHHAIELDRCCMVHSTPQSQAATIRHHEAVKELVSIRGSLDGSSDPKAYWGDTQYHY